MLSIANKIIYKAFGLSIMSEIPLRELPFSNYEEDANIDLFITKDALIREWNEIADKNQSFWVNKNLVMYKFQEIAIFSMRDGNRISVSPLKEYDENIAKLVILGTCMGAILMQRKLLPLHGSSIAINEKAYTIIGNSGAGKSTLAFAFLNKGFPLLTDDVIAVSLKDDIPYVTPSYPQQKLWEDSLNGFGIERGNYKSIFGRENKFNIPVKNYSSDPLPLGGIIELVPSENDEVIIHPIENLERFYTLFNHTYRNIFVRKLGLMGWHFDLSAKIINKANFYKVNRPIANSSSSQLMSAILKIINEE